MGLKGKKIMLARAFFSREGIPCHRFGSVELSDGEIESFLEEGISWLLVRTHAYQFERAVIDGRFQFRYCKVPTKSQENTLPHRFFALRYDEIKDYLKEE